MRVVMVNDCSYIGETLLKFLPKEINRTHIRRTDKFLDKTVNIAWKIFRARGDIFHCHYLLQDCLLTLKFGKRPTIGHAHGSDIRQTIKSSTLGRIVRYNLKECDKIIVSTPNLLETAKEYNESTEYLPNIVNQKLFFPKTPAQTDTKRKLRILVASASDWNIRGTRQVIEALNECKNDVETTIIRYGVDIEKTLKLAKSLNLHVDVLPPIPHSKINRYYWNFDAIIAAIGIGGTLGVIALEAIACGRPVITHVSSKFTEYKRFPLLDVSTKDQIVNAILSLEEKKLLEKESAYFRSFHDPAKILKRLIKIYNDLIGLKRSD